MKFYPLLEAVLKLIPQEQILKTTALKGIRRTMHENRRKEDINGMTI